MRENEEEKTHRKKNRIKQGYLRLSPCLQSKNSSQVTSKVKACLMPKAKLLMGNAPVFVRANRRQLREPS